MSGSGRKSTYRKGVTHQVLYGTPEPKPNESIVRVIQLRGSNHFEVENAQGHKSLTMLPTKFRKLIWVKKGDFLIVSSGEMTDDGSTTEDNTNTNTNANSNGGGGGNGHGGGSGGVSSIIEHILKKDQIRHLKQKNLWPAEFDESKPNGNKWEANAVKSHDDQEHNTNADEEEEGEEVEEDEEEDQTPEPSKTSDRGIQMMSDAYFVNRNRPKGYFEEEEEEEDSEEED